jgi:hypothetical protein
MTTDLANTLRDALGHLQAFYEGRDDSGPERAYETVHSALVAIERSQRGPRCEAPACGKSLDYKGVGPYPRFCDSTCRQRAYRAQQAARG